FVVVLLPSVQQYGLSGLLVSGLMAGILLIIMGLTKLGRLIEVVPYPVTVGFTSGIAVVIGTLQIKDFLGLPIESLDGHYLDKLLLIIQSLAGVDWQELLIGALTLTVLIVWAKLKSSIPGHLVALLVGTLTAVLLNQLNSDFTVATIGSRFHYFVGDIMGSGIPPFLPEFIFPWNQAGPDGTPLELSFELIRSLIGPAITIALLGAIESLLCAVVADGMSGTKHRPNKELIGQGIGNIITPFFGGIPATAAIARTAASICAGASSPVSSIVHGLFILAAIMLLAPALSYIPMAALAALLLMVAWNMSEIKSFMRIIAIAPREDMITLLTCFTLTVVFDMVVAVGVGMGLAAILFINRSIQLTEIIQHQDKTEHPHLEDLPKEIIIYDINGPLFFGSAQKALHSIATVNSEVKVLILDMSDVSMLDMSAIIVMESLVGNLHKQSIGLVINNLQPRLILKLRPSGVRRREGSLDFSRNIHEAIDIARKTMLLQS
ncbi:MAG: C4-dicarboxylic acid transporter DauA, partial [Gammaproteobacteria bacterium]|nr:C4-dicarboxylic acid transporter DauA [Gammaproteobacteria bacterium]